MLDAAGPGPGQRGGATRTARRRCSAISVDSHYAPGRFAGELGLTRAVLLADFEPKGAVSRAYDVHRDQNAFSGRASFVIDTGGIVRGVSHTDDPGRIPDEEEYFAALAACSL